MAPVETFRRPLSKSQLETEGETTALSVRSVIRASRAACLFPIQMLSCQSEALEAGIETSLISQVCHKERCANLFTAEPESVSIYVSI